MDLQKMFLLPSEPKAHLKLNFKIVTNLAHEPKQAPRMAGSASVTSAVEA